MNLPTKDSATSRGIKTALQTMIGFLVGLALVVWTVPGVPLAVIKYIESNLVSTLLVIGVPSGLVAYIWNYFRQDVLKY